jgi:hypothetical protein
MDASRPAEQTIVFNVPIPCGHHDGRRPDRTSLLGETRITAGLIALRSYAYFPIVSARIERHAWLTCLHIINARLIDDERSSRSSTGGGTVVAWDVVCAGDADSTSLPSTRFWSRRAPTPPVAMHVSPRPLWMRQHSDALVVPVQWPAASVCSTELGRFLFQHSAAERSGHGPITREGSTKGRFWASATGSQVT